MGEALTKYLRKDGTAALIAGGLLVCASVFVSPAAWADDSLWGKTLNTLGLGGGQPAQDSANPPPAAQAPTPAAPSRPAAPPSKQAAQPKQNAQPVANNAASAPAGNAVVVESSQAAAPAQSPNLWSDWFGLGRDNGSSSAQAPAPAQSAALQQKAINPVAAPANSPAPPAPASAPSMWDNMIGSIGLGANNPTANVNYSERPKLSVPKERNLPQPNATPESTATRSANSEALTKPPGDYLEKVKGADGNVSGLRDSDIPKDKKLFGLFSFGSDDSASSYSGSGFTHAH